LNNVRRLPYQPYVLAHAKVFGGKVGVGFCRGAEGLKKSRSAPTIERDGGVRFAA
jgi:hypothetical protein